MADPAKPETQVIQPAPLAPKTFTAEEVEKMVAAQSAKAVDALLSKLGAKSSDEISAALGKYRETEEAQKSELQRLVEFKTKAEADLAAAKTYRERFGAMLNKQIDGLTPERKAALAALAGDDPLKLATTLEVLGPTWAAVAPPEAPKVDAPPAPPVQITPAAAAPKPPAAPLSAALPAGAPAAAAPRSKFDEWQAIRSPIARDVFYSAHGKAIEESRPAPQAN